MNHLPPRLLLTLVCTLTLALILPTSAHAGDTLPPDAFAGPCTEWVPVNNPAFDLDSGDNYNSEEGFEVFVFDGQLYVGMEADNSLGSRLWRTRDGVAVPGSQTDWEEVAAVDSKPFGCDQDRQNDHIDSLAELDGVLYASNANGGTTTYGTLVYSSTTGDSGSWFQVAPAGFGDVDNTNFKDMVRFSTGGTDWLCGGTMNEVTGAQVWCTSNGATWQQRNAGGFGDPANVLLASSAVFSDALYFGVYRAGGPGNVWRTTDLVTWTQVFTAPIADRERVEVLGVLGDHVYVAAGDYDGRRASDPPIRIFRSATGDPGDWAEVGQAIGAGDPHSTRTIVDGATVYNGALYVAVMNATTGVEVWRTADGLAWSQVNADGFGDPDNLMAEMIPFNGYLYAWTSNYAIGQQVFRSACPICQTSPVTQAGPLSLSAVGATITLTAGAPDVVTACVYPDSPQPSPLAPPTLRRYTIDVAPAGAVFTANLALAYTAEEYTRAHIVGADTLYLARQTSDGWTACDPAQRARDAATPAVICHDITAPSTWAVAGTGGAPLHLAFIAADATGSVHYAALGYAIMVGVMFVRQATLDMHKPQE